MIIVRLSGGLGNQMFQYALGRKLSLQNRDTFKLDLSVYTPENNRFYELKSLNIIENFASKEESRRIQFQYGIFSKINSFIQKKIFRNFNIGFNKKVLNKKGDIYLEGFWQSPKYFADIAHTIHQDFRLRNRLSHSAEIALNQIKSCPISVSIHIRRGDYVKDPKTNRHHGVCSMEYYKKALEVLERLLGPKEIAKIKLFVFSDDIEWVEKNVKLPFETKHMTNGSINNPETMFLMSNCNHNIIANSTFSWWGAWLNPNRSKIVIAPGKWNLAQPSEYKDLIPKEWIKI